MPVHEKGVRETTDIAIKTSTIILFCFRNSFWEISDSNHSVWTGMLINNEENMYWVDGTPMDFIACRIGLNNNERDDCFYTESEICGFINVIRNHNWGFKSCDRKRTYICKITTGEIIVLCITYLPIK